MFLLATGVIFNVKAGLNDVMLLSCSHLRQEVGMFVISVKTRIKKIKLRINENMKR